MPVELPPLIAAYFEADKGTTEAVLPLFAPDAVVHDEGFTYRGSAEIRRWRTEAASKYTYTCEPRSVDHQVDATVVTCWLEGNFPGGATALRFSFQINKDKIAALEVTP